MNKIEFFSINSPKFFNYLKMKRQDNGNEQLNSIRNEFNGRVESKSYLGRTKRVTWTGNRRFRTI